MFTWNSPQPLPSRLKELLDRSGAINLSDQDAPKADVLIFLPPDFILSCCRLTFDSILHSYQGLLDSVRNAEKENQQLVLVNGSRILSLGAGELQAWQPGSALPKNECLTHSTPLDSVLTTALIVKAPELLTLYLELDELSERGGAKLDENYIHRINVSDPEQLVDDLNRHHASRHEINHEQYLRQLLEIEKECEQQFLSKRHLALKLKHIHILIKSYEQLMSRFIALETNFLQ